MVKRASLALILWSGQKVRESLFRRLRRCDDDPAGQGGEERTTGRATYREEAGHSSVKSLCPWGKKNIHGIIDIISLRFAVATEVERPLRVEGNKIGRPGGR